MDISRACFNAKTTRAGRTSAAPASATWGFRQTSASACIFRDEERLLAVSFHGGDFTASGPKSFLDLYVGEMQKWYELTIGGRLCPGANDDREATVLNRVVRWTAAGLQYEVDPRQVERLLTKVELAAEKANGSATPAAKALAHHVADEQELHPEMQTPYRAWVARANYLAADRTDCLFAAKEVCRFMSKPTTLAMISLKRLCRYLLTQQLLGFRYDYQRATHINTYSDTDHAGCVRTRNLPQGVAKWWADTSSRRGRPLRRALP